MSERTRERDVVAGPSWRGVPGAWPRISVVTPSYNQGRFIEETLQSVLSQAYPNLEYIVVDGGSTDNSVEVIRKHAGHLAWWVSEKDRGQAHAINKGFAHAAGEVFTFLNSDDLLEPGSLLAMGAAFADSAEWVTSAIRSFRAGCPDTEEPALEEAEPCDWLMRNLIPQPGTAWASGIFHRLGGFREDLHCAFDYEYWLRIRFRAGVKPRILPRRLASFRYQDASKTVSQSEAFEPEERRIRAEYRRFLDPLGQIRSWLWERQHLADRRQLRGLDEAARGRRLAAVRDAVASVGFWPPILFQRRTAGLIRRSLVAKGSQGPSAGE